MKTELLNKTSRFFNKAGLKIKQHSPEILMVAGIAGTVTSTVLACKATTKVDEVLAETKYKVDIIHESTEKGHVVGREDVEYTQDDCKKDLTIIYTQTGVKLLKLYAPALALGAVSIASIVTGHNILKKRNIALAAAYVAVDKGFKEYRKNVVDRFGEAIDKELRYNVKAKEVEVLDENGNPTGEKKIINEVTKTEYSDFSRIFDSSCAAFTKDPEANIMFLRRQQDYANELLRSRGFLFLNEVFDLLDFPRTPGGQIVGWMYNSSNEYADNYVDFGIYRPGNERFINGLEYNVWLDFNIDGPIIEEFYKHPRNK